MGNPYNRHDVTDDNWNKLEPIITGLLGKWGGCNATDTRLFVNACLWIIRTGSPWRTYQLHMGNLTLYTVAISDGVIKEFGIKSWQS